MLAGGHPLSEDNASGTQSETSVEESKSSKKNTIYCGTPTEHYVPSSDDWSVTQLSSEDYSSSPIE